ncbi:polyprenol reductase, putative [Plasmodium chabaudi chabaudi]|uniref:Polyprenol reductase, putative n=1 Tax=Plasmodium chabaudi chabaudi TaxID=31271 RepID=A0A1D3LH96_PLACU|nr:polyprenol reductase, putative [Plasmodium chabaudi chabaudi]
MKNTICSLADSHLKQITLLKVICILYYVIGILILLISFFSKTITNWSLHGKNMFIKLEQDEEKYSCMIHRLKKWFDDIIISKKYFSHFYFVGLIINSAILLQDINEASRNNYNAYEHISKTNIMFEIHLLRRLLEQIFVVKTTSKSFMHILSYCLGVSFYLVTPFSLHNKNIHKITVLKLLSIILFIIGNLIQYDSHVRLAKLRSKALKNNESPYKVPYGGLFDFVSCPHYFSEILIYFSFFLSNLDIICILNCLMVLLILIKNGIQTHRWYLKTMQDTYPKQRRIIFPFLF